MKAPETEESYRNFVFLYLSFHTFLHKQWIPIKINEPQEPSGAFPGSDVLVL